MYIQHALQETFSTGYVIRRRPWLLNTQLKHIKRQKIQRYRISINVKNSIPIPKRYIRLRALKTTVKSNIGWEGKDIVFMQKNEHPREREGIWKTEGLEGTVKKLVEGDRDSGNWLKKLSLVNELLVSSDSSNDMKKGPDIESLGYSHVYLSWISRGIVPCIESGGHYRPKHHAEMSKSIFRALEWVSEPGKNSKEVIWAARAIQNKLPSFADEFRRAEPLTRIRDIAHRNDIPKDMKHEIKHTLQNKLHRNAGPEDLIAAQIMYDRILKDKDKLSSSFVDEFGVFMEELREFFNAGYLSEFLEKIHRSMKDFDPSGAAILDRFLDIQSNLDHDFERNASYDKRSNLLIEALHSVTTVRALLISKLSSGLRNDASDTALASRQIYRLAEIKAEEFAFLLLSRFANLMESSRIYENLASGSDRSWALPLGALTLGVRHVALSGWEPMECGVIDKEISSWYSAGSLHIPENALRLRATLERLQRLSSNFCDSLLNIFTEKAHKLGTGLGVTGHHVTMYSESEIRASPVFQVSKLTSILLKAARQVAGQSAWDILVPGVARGLLVEVNSIDSVAMPPGMSAESNLVLLVKRATGDEEVGHLVSGFTGTGMRVSGIILCQELPHLSHLGVRARQEHLVFTTCTDSDLITNDIEGLMGKFVELDASSDGVIIYESVSAESDTTVIDEDSPAVKIREIIKVNTNWKDTNEDQIKKTINMTKDTCGPKASNCAVLESLAISTRQFKVPMSISIPFGIMEKSLSDKPSKIIENLLLEADNAIDMKCSVELIEGITERVRNTIISECKVPKPLLRSIMDEFEKDDVNKVIVRSSANVEDLAGMSGAGLHDSFSNISADNEKELEMAIVKVWASLHTRRAVMARHSGKVPHKMARMAILIQEQLNPDVSFVLHTTDPLTKDHNQLSAEIAPGVGETLASGTRGTPWRLQIDKKSKDVKTKAFANFSAVLLPRERDDDSWENFVDKEEEKSKLKSKVADYSNYDLSINEGKRIDIGIQLMEIGKNLEKEFGNIAQDIEGAICDDEIYIVQSRPQPL